MIGFWDFKLTGAPPLLSLVVRRRRGDVSFAMIGRDGFTATTAHYPRIGGPQMSDRSPTAGIVGATACLLALLTSVLLPAISNGAADWGEALPAIALFELGTLVWSFGHVGSRTAVGCSRPLWWPPGGSWAAASRCSVTTPP